MCVCVWVFSFSTAPGASVWRSCWSSGPASTANRLRYRCPWWTVAWTQFPCWPDPAFRLPRWSYPGDNCYLTDSTAGTGWSAGPPCPSAAAGPESAQSGPRRSAGVAAVASECSYWTPHCEPPPPPGESLCAAASSSSAGGVAAAAAVVSVVPHSGVWWGHHLSVGWWRRRRRRWACWRPTAVVAEAAMSLGWFCSVLRVRHRRSRWWSVRSAGVCKLKVRGKGTNHFRTLAGRHAANKMDNLWTNDRCFAPISEDFSAAFCMRFLHTISNESNLYTRQNLV